MAEETKNTSESKNGKAEDAEPMMTLNCKVPLALGTQFKVLGIVQGKNINDLLGEKVRETVEQGGVEITVGGEKVDLAKLV